MADPDIVEHVVGERPQVISGSSSRQDRAQVVVSIHGGKAGSFV
jgi:hypothetical protein